MIEWLPELLFEGSLIVYAILGVALVSLIIIWKQTPRRAYLVGSIVLAVLIGVYALLDVLVETDREQITHVFQEMSAGVETHNVDRIFNLVSDGYNRHGLTKAAFRAASASVIDTRMVERMAVWGWEFESDYKQKASPSDARATTARVRFMAKPESTMGQNLYLVEAVMHRDSDGKWRLQSWEVYDPFHNADAPLVVPQVP